MAMVRVAPPSGHDTRNNVFAVLITVVALGIGAVLSTYGAEIIRGAGIVLIVIATYGLFLWFLWPYRSERMAATLLIAAAAFAGLSIASLIGYAYFSSSSPTIKVYFGDSYRWGMAEIPHHNIDDLPSALLAAKPDILRNQKQANLRPNQEVVNSVILRNVGKSVIKNAFVTVSGNVPIKGRANDVRKFSDTQFSYEIPEIQPYSDLGEETALSTEIDVPDQPETTVLLTVTIRSPDISSKVFVQQIIFDRPVLNSRTDNGPQSVFQLFAADFPNLLHRTTTEKINFRTPSGSIGALEVKVMEYLDFSEANRFVGVYLPASSDLPGLCLHALKSLGQFMADNEKAARATETAVGQNASASSSDLKFSGQVYFYYEGDLTDNEATDLKMTARQLGFTLNLRGEAYARDLWLQQRASGQH